MDCLTLAIESGNASGSKDDDFFPGMVSKIPDKSGLAGAGFSGK